MNILVVESKAKAKTIQKYLGSDWVVLATGGHIQQHADKKADPRRGGQACWANRSGELPDPPWMWTDNGEEAVQAILTAAEGPGEPHFYLATDPDREGELIAWHLQVLLAPHGPTSRVTFQEVTREAVVAALAQPHELDMNRVRSALVRGLQDRLVGFRSSRLAKGIVAGRSASMGRVQTPALGFIVDRELEREAHVPVPYFEVSVVTPSVDLQVRFHEPSDPARWTDDKDKFVATRTLDNALAEGAAAAIEATGRLTLTGVEPTERTQHPKPPFTTDALLQAAGSRWGWSPKKTNALAAQLYHGGHITYLRTDSTRLSQAFVTDARAHITARWGVDHLGPGATGKPSAAKVQDAHEAIRPTRIEAVPPHELDDDAQRLYTLIRAQVLASQMAPSLQARLALTAEVPGLDRPLTGSVSWYTRLGWRAAFAGLDPQQDQSPPLGLEPGATLLLSPGDDERPNPLLKEGETQPPGRYRGHSLVRAMKVAGIGRPSTYASTLEKLLERRYVEVDSGALAPTPNGRCAWLEVAPLYALPDGEPLFESAYTAVMEARLDDIEDGSAAAPVVWEALRDAFRAAHASAQQQRSSGKQSAAQRQRLDALVARAPEALVAGIELDGLTWKETAELSRRLDEAGVKPAPSAPQQAEIARLIALLGLDPDAAAGLVELASLAEVETGAQASALITAMRARVPASDRQLRTLRDLVKRAGLTEAEACARVEAADFASLTGGREGTASRLIGLLKRDTRRPGRDPA